MPYSLTHVTARVWSGRFCAVASLLVAGCFSSVEAQTEVPAIENPPLDKSQSSSPTAVLPRDGFVEFGVQSANLTDGYDNWSGFYTRTAWQQNQKSVWNAEVNYQDHFGESGTFFSLGNTYTFNEDWYGSLSLGSSTGGSFLPKFRADAFINRKLLPKRNLVASLGLGYYQAREIYRDRSVALGATYYFPTPWIAEGGVRFNTSNPGSVDSQSQFVALTNGRDKKRYLTLRYEWGNEAYQVTGDNQLISDFDSNNLSFTWRQWLGQKQGFNLVAERYSNPFYKRQGVNLGYFRDF